MNRRAVRIFASHAANLSEMERFQVARIVAEQACGGPFDAEELAISDALVERLGDRDWFHGGLPGREAGEFLLPAEVTGNDPRSCGDEIMDRAKFVYVTPSRTVAEEYANHANGKVYRVKPLGPMIVDPAEQRTFLLVARAFGPMKELRQAGPLWIAEQMASGLKGCAVRLAEVLAE